MIDPSDVIKYDRTDSELQEWWLFSIVVAGKTARTQAQLLDNFLNAIAHYGETPFEAIRAANVAGVLEDELRASHLGQYTRIMKCFLQSLDVNIREASVAELETIHGIGPKTARMFVMHSRKDARYAALDTHILKFLADAGHEVPKTTPSGAKYALLEAAFLELADEAGMSPSEYDLEIWKSYAK